MLKNSIFLKTAFSYAPLALLPTSAVVTPLAVIAAGETSDVKMNVKRAYNASEESGLNYNTAGGINPFLSLDGSSTTYGLENVFYTRKDHLSHNDYRTFEWSNLSPSGPVSEISLWLSQLNNYLEDPNNKYPVQVSSSKPSDYKGGQEEFSMNNDFSSNQAIDMDLSWRTQQMGFGLQDNLASFINSQSASSSPLVFPKYIQNSEQFPTNQYLWKTLTGSDFYTNYTTVTDPEKSHYPHEYKFNLKTPATPITQDYDTNHPTPPVLKYKVIFNSDGGSHVDSQEVEYGKKIVKPQDPTKEGFNFDGWWHNNVYRWDFDQQTVTGETLLVAHWINKSDLNSSTVVNTNSSVNADTPKNVSGKRILFDFPSEYLTEEQAANYKTVTALSDLFSFVPVTSYQPTFNSIFVPDISQNAYWFGFDSQEEKKTPSTYANSGDKIFNALYPTFATGSDEQKIFGPTALKRPAEHCFTNANYLPEGTLKTFAYYIPTFNTRNMYSIPGTAPSASPKAIDIPVPVHQHFPSSENEAFVNFMDYYNLDSQGSLSCDVTIDGSTNSLVYNFKSGNQIVSTQTATISPEFKQFFNMCLSSMQTDVHYADFTKGDLKFQSDKGYLSLASSGDNSIINLKSTIGSSSAIDTNVPFCQDVSGDKSTTFDNSISAQSLGFGFSTSNDSTAAISSPTEVNNNNYLLNLALVFNKISLNSTSTGYSNKMMCNLDYLLAIDPTTANFYNKTNDGGTTITPVEIKLNPYYIQAAANAYSAYNFWLTFATNPSIQAGLAKISGGKQAVYGTFRDLIMRGFIKSQKQAEALVKNLDGRHISAAVPPEMADSYYGKDILHVNSYSKLTNPKEQDYTYAPCDDFNWNISFFNSNAVKEGSGESAKHKYIWPDEDGNPKYQETDPTYKISQGTWAPFCWQYGIAPSTWSFLKSIPNDYKFEVPYGYVFPSKFTEKESHWKHFDRGNLSGTQRMSSKDITWSELLHGESIKLDFPDDLKEEMLKPNGKWSNVSVVIGTTGSSQPELQGVHGYMPSTAKQKTAFTRESGAPVKLAIPNFGSIKLATISNNNHLNATTTNSIRPFDMNVIQQYSSKENRKKYIKSSKDINYLPSTACPAVLALHKQEAKLLSPQANNMSNNTYLVTKVNGNSVDLLEDMSNYFTISPDGTLGVELEVVKWRESLEEIHGKYYKSVNESITGKYVDQLQENKWSMFGVAPEDWFNEDQKVMFNGYSTYKWAFHPSGLWSYKMQFYQDPNEEAVESGDQAWDTLQQKYNLDYSIWGHPVIEPITRTSYVPDRIIQGHDEIDPTTGESVHIDGWKDKATKAGVINPVFHTNNTTLELAFKVTYKDFAFTSNLFPGKQIMPVQYVYIPNLTYNFSITKQANETKASVNSYSKLNNQYGDYAPSFLDRWENHNNDGDKPVELDTPESLFSTHDSYHLLESNEVINFYKSPSTNGLYRSNVYFSNFMSLYKNGWVYIKPEVISNPEHTLSFKIYYSADILVNQQFFAENPSGTKLKEKNLDYLIQTLPNKQQIKVPLIPGLIEDPEGKKTTTEKWYCTETITITDFRCVGTEWSTVKGQNRMTPFVIGLIVACCLTPAAIIATGVGLHKIRTKTKKIK